jgi:hypothetical protein
MQSTATSFEILEKGKYLTAFYTKLMNFSERFNRTDYSREEIVVQIKKTEDDFL